MLFPKKVFAANFSFENLEKNSDTSDYTLEVKYTGDTTLQARFKIGASIDESSYSLAETYNSDSSKYLTYSTTWNSVPLVSLDKNATLKIKFKFVSSFSSDTFYLRLRYRNESNSNSYDTDYSSEINLKSTNTNLLIISTSSPTPTPTEDDLSTSETVTANVIYSTPSPNNLSKEEIKNIAINEFMPNPETGENEWVEIINKNSKKIILTDWYIDDNTDSGGSAFKFSCTVDADDFCIVQISTSLLNNTGDEKISLLNYSKQLLHQISYSKTVKDKSIQKLQNGKWYITNTNTKGKENLEYKEENVYSINPDEDTVEDFDSTSEKKDEEISENINSSELSSTSNVLGTFDFKIPNSSQNAIKEKYFESEYVDLNVSGSNNKASILDILINFFKLAYFRD
ncbi:lamin tail domain-containing protein [Patescibacteria group bacterium]|nr:lamin tail domain-containing protein [Patescibacteria group bacterium]